MKRIVNLLISLGLCGFDWLRDATRRLLHLPLRQRCVVLAYHSVSSQDRERFGGQLDFLQRHAEPVPAGIEVLPAKVGRYAAITFDDGLQCIVDNALPELAARRIPSVFFVVAGVLGRKPDWQYFGGDDPSVQPTVTEDTLREIGSDLVTIGSHTLSHTLLPRMSAEEMEREILGSRAKLEALLGQPVELLSFPYGAFDEKVVERCRQAGYTRVFTALPVMAISTPHEFVTGRVGVAVADWPIEFRLKLAGAYRWLPRAFVWKRRILTMFSQRAAAGVFWGRG